MADDGHGVSAVAEEASRGLKYAVLLSSSGKIIEVPGHLVTDTTDGGRASGAAKVPDTKFPESSSSTTSFHSRSSLSIPKKQPEESLSGRDGNDCDFQEDRMPKLSSGRPPSIDQSSGKASPPKYFPTVYEVFDSFPQVKHAHSAAVLSDCSFEDDITLSKSWPCSHSLSQRSYAKVEPFRKESSRSVYQESSEEMVASGHTLKMKDDLYCISVNLKGATAQSLECGGANSGDESEYQNEFSSSSGTIGEQDDRGRESPVGLDLCSVDTEVAFDSRDPDLESDSVQDLASDLEQDLGSDLKPGSEPDSKPDLNSSYEAQVQFPAAVEDSHDALISHQVIPTSCSDSNSSGQQAASSSEPQSSGLQTAAGNQNVNVFEGFGDIGSHRHTVTASTRENFIFIFASTEKVFTIDFTQEMPSIGKGGRNMVFSDKSGLFAIKRCNYQKDVLNIIYKLKHPNVISLLGVVLVDPRTSNSCLHIMPRMSTDLYRAWEHYRTEGLVKLLSDVTEEPGSRPLEEGVVLLSENSANLFRNVVYILKEVASGLVYLDSLELFHGDIKDQNILLSYCLACKSLFSCCCREKFPVMIADFDSICHAGNDPSHSHVGGTVGYRAPEVCSKGKGIESDSCLCGSKSDVYSLGVVKLRMLCGRKDIAQAKRDANLINRQPALKDTLSIENELLFVQTLKVKLSSLIMNLENQDLKFLFLVAVHCCEPDARQRLSANELFEKLFEKLKSCV